MATADISAREDEALVDSSSGSTSSTVEEARDFSVDDGVESLGFGAFHLLIVLFCGMGTLIVSSYDAQISILSVILKCEWGLSVSQEALVTSVYFIGSLCSTQFWGYMADTYGRRRVLYLGNALLTIFGILTALAPYYGWMLVLRALTAFASGTGIAGVTYLTELIPHKCRGIAVQSLEIFYVIGSILTIGVGMAMIPTVGWRWYLATSAILSLPLMIIAFILPESPRYLVLKGQTHKAQSLLAKIARFNCKPSLSARLQSEGKKEANQQQHSTVSDGEQRDTDDQNGETANESSVSPSTETVVGDQDKMCTGCIFTHLFKKGMWRTTILLWIIWLTSTAYYFGTFLLATSLFRFREHCNTGGLPNLDICKNLQPEDYIGVMWTTSSELPGIILIAFLFPFFGRRVLMAGGLTLCAIFTGLLYLCQPREVTTAFLFCGRACISGSSQIMFLYTAEVYPTEARALGLGIATAMASMGGIVMPYIAQVLLQASDLAGISVFLVMLIACTVAIILLPIETKGKSLSETGSMQSKKGTRGWCQLTPCWKDYIKIHKRTKITSYLSPRWVADKSCSEFHDSCSWVQTETVDYA